MSTTGYSFSGPRRMYPLGRGWSRKVDVCGSEYVVGVERGKPTRARGFGRGFLWHGFVRSSVTGKDLWTSRVNKSTGAKRLLEDSGFICKNCGLPPRLHVPSGGFCMPGLSR
jgi:hypothetical protein